MAYDIVKFKRGQLWMVTTKSTNINGHEQAKNRPWLVLSIGKFNQSSGMITAVPCTTRDATVTPAQVRFRNLKGDYNVIMCEQIKTFDYNSADYFFNYMGELSEEVMTLVDKALIIHLGINHTPQPTTIDKLYEVVDRYATAVSKDKNAPAFTDDDVIRFAEKLESLLGPVNPELHKMEDKDVIDFTTQLGNTLSDEIIEKVTKDTPAEASTKQAIIASTEIKAPDKDSSKGSKKKSGYWTKTKCEEFLSDIDNLPMKEVMEKWGFEKKARVYTTKFYVQNLLKNS